MTQPSEEAPRLNLKTTLPDGKLVSTVQLNYNTVFMRMSVEAGKETGRDFETMVFPSDSYVDLDVEQYDTKEAAIAGHVRMVMKWSKPERQHPHRDIVDAEIVK